VLLLLPAEDYHRFFCLQITLLDGKRSLNVNIFLKQFRRCVCCQAMLHDCKK